MRTYRAIWGASMALVTVVAALGSGRLGLGAVAGVSVALALLGGLLGVAWAAIDRRWRLAGQCALWFGVCGPLLIGLPTVIGAWTLLALPLLGVGAPPLVQHTLGYLHGRRPVRAASRARPLSDGELRCRWRRTSEELVRRDTTPAAALRLVQERALLLDEIERRDPAAFEAQLVRAGWHSARPAIDI